MEKNNQIIQELLLKAIQQLQETSNATNQALIALQNQRESVVQEPGGADKRLFVEIWEHVFKFLYPSQIARLSRTSRTMHRIISSSSYWSRLFKRIFGSDYQLDTLAAMPESKSYMLYLCAISARICENCWGYFPPPKSAEDIAARPLPVLLPNTQVLRRNNRSLVDSKGDGQKRKTPTFVGGPNNTNWAIMVCHFCRRSYYRDNPEPLTTFVVEDRYISMEAVTRIYGLTRSDVVAIPSSSMGFIRSSYGASPTEISEASSTDNTGGIRSRTFTPRRKGVSFSSRQGYPQEQVLKIAREKYGGSVGVKAFQEKDRIAKQDQKTQDRIDAYCNE